MDRVGDSLSGAATILVSGPASGTLTLNPDGSFTYQPGPDFNGTDSFTYKASDGTDESAPATVTIDVSPVDDAPQAVDDHYGMNEDGTLAIAAPGLLSNDLDVDNSTLTVLLVSGPAHGVLTLNPDGGFSYSPNPDYNGARQEGAELPRLRESSMQLAVGSASERVCARRASAPSNRYLSTLDRSAAVCRPSSRARGPGGQTGGCRLASRRNVSTAATRRCTCCSLARSSLVKIALTCFSTDDSDSDSSWAMPSVTSYSERRMCPGRRKRPV